MYVGQMTDQQLSDDFYYALVADVLEEEAKQERPLLAHYTTIGALEQILRTKQLWLANPVNMNDLEEVRYGIFTGFHILRAHEGLQHALGSADRQNTFFTTLAKYADDFSATHLVDTYVACFSRHDVGDTDGRLSMWRAYGDNGNGVALVIDTSQIAPINPNPLILSRVKYGTHAERAAWLTGLGDILAQKLQSRTVETERLSVISNTVFDRLKLFALFTKHKGFDDEREWRIAYLADRDGNGALNAMKDYHIGPRGLEPKLKLQLRPIPGVLQPDFALEKITAGIILGPSNNTRELAMASVRRMLSIIEPKLAGKLYASQIPFRPK